MFVALQSFLVATLVAAVLYVPAPRQVETPAAKGCAAAEFRAFDFWVGDWDVKSAQGRKAGENCIASVESGCALLERWTGAGGVTGTSLTFYDRGDRRWHQSWMDGAGNALRLAGAHRGTSMVLESTPSGGRVERVSWTPGEDGRVRQLWESSKDDGKTWTVTFDGTYVKKTRAARADRCGATR